MLASALGAVLIQLLAFSNPQPSATAAPAATAPFGDSWPGGTPELFAPGIVNTDSVEINLVFNRGCTELFFARAIEKIFFIYASRLVDTTWTAPVRLDLMNPGDQAADMALAPDEQSLFFLGITAESTTTRSDIWVSERTNEGWSRARSLGPAVNTAHSEFYPTVVADGSLYFVSDRPNEFGPRTLYCARRQADGSFAPAIAVGPPIDTEQEKGDTYVAPDERYIIFKSNSRQGFGSGDLFIALRTADGGWTEPKNMGPTINSKELESCPMVSPAGMAIPGRRPPTQRSTGWMRRSSKISGMNNQCVAGARRASLPCP